MNTESNDSESFEKEFLAAARHRFEGYRKMGEAAMAQLSSGQLFEKPSPESNSIGIIVQHMAGNMLSRWTDFLSSDGEKAWRDRDLEFELHTESREALMDKWNNGWNCLLDTLRQLDGADLLKEIRIRTEILKAYDAIIRQMMHYSYHIGQIVLLAKWLKGADWQSLSIPKDKSADYNKQMGMQS